MPQYQALGRDTIPWLRLKRVSICIEPVRQALKMTNDPQIVRMSDIVEFDLKCGRDFLINSTVCGSQMMSL